MNDSTEKSVVAVNAAPASMETKTGGEKLVDAKTLLTLLWDERSRPSIRWLRQQQSLRAIPYVKLGARVWFNPRQVRHHLQERWTVKRR